MIFYGQKVKRLIEDEDGPDLWLPEDLGHILSAALPPSSRYLLPELQEIYWPSSEEACHFIRLLLPPTIRIIRIETVDAEPLALSCFYNLPQLCPATEKVQILDSADVPFMEIGLVLRSFASLRHLTLEDANTESVRYIAESLPQITHLRLEFYFKKESPSNPPNSFPHLLHLQLSLVGFEFAAKMLSCISSTALEHFSLRGTPTSSEECWSNVLSRLKPFQYSLRFLKIKEIAVHNPTRYRMTRKGLVDVLVFHNLSHFLVTADVEWDISDDFLRDLSRNCPRLIAIKLWSRQVSQRNPGVTLNALYFLAQHCPNLSTIKICLDARSVPAIPEPKIPTGNRALDSLVLGLSPITTSVKVAAFLHYLFPRLKEIVSKMLPLVNGYSRLWQQTSLHLQAIREVQSYN